MQDALVRSAYSNIIKEGHDCSAALFDTGGEVIAQATALPAQLGVLPTAVKRMVAMFEGQLSGGDVLILNDPYDGGTHLPDICLIAPVVKDGAVAAYAACIAHHQDVGGAGGKSPTTRPTSFRKACVFRRSSFTLAASATKPLSPSSRAMCACRKSRPATLVRSWRRCTSASRGLRLLLDEHGAPAFRAYMAELLDRHRTCDA